VAPDPPDHETVAPEPVRLESVIVVGAVGGSVGAVYNMPVKFDTVDDAVDPPTLTAVTIAP
jgi:hypothetical protein